MEKEIIEKRALETLEKAKDDGDAAINIIGLAKNLGFVVVNAELNSTDDGFIIIDENQSQILDQETNKLIGVRTDQSLEWKRFIIAHEIGHFVLHYNKDVDNGMYAHREHKKGKNTKENEADYFAANLLMPSDRFRKNYQELDNSKLSFDEIILILAKRFCVTDIMARRRVEELSLSD